MTKPSDLPAMIGHETVSKWFEITQARIDAFADATEDWQFIHNDPEAAKASPFGGTIAHGFLTLSLLPELTATAMVIDDVKMSINYGLNRVRFTGPVPAGSRVRAVITLKGYDVIDGGAQMTTEVTIEREGATKPVCVAESVSRRFA